MRAAIGDGDLVARLGGDEFAVVLADADEAIVQAAAERLGAQFELPFELSTVTLDIAVSIGVAFAPAHGEDIEELLRAADVALYRAKAARSGFMIYDPELGWEHRNRKPLLADLHRALEAGEFMPYFQPKADARTRRIIGVETLLRWQHPTHGVLSPHEFLALLDRSGVIRHVTADLVDTTLAQIAAVARSRLGAARRGEPLDAQPARPRAPGGHRGTAHALRRAAVPARARSHGADDHGRPQARHRRARRSSRKSASRSRSTTSEPATRRWRTSR